MSPHEAKTELIQFLEANPHPTKGSWTGKMLPNGLGKGTTIWRLLQPDKNTAWTDPRLKIFRASLNEEIIKLQEMRPAAQGGSAKITETIATLQRIVKFLDDAISVGGSPKKLQKPSIPVSFSAMPNRASHDEAFDFDWMNANQGLYALMAVNFLRTGKVSELNGILKNNNDTYVSKLCQEMKIRSEIVANIMKAVTHAIYHGCEALFKAKGIKYPEFQIRGTVHLLVPRHKDDPKGSYRLCRISRSGIDEDLSSTEKPSATAIATHMGPDYVVVRAIEQARFCRGSGVGTRTRRQSAPLFVIAHPIRMQKTVISKYDAVGAVTMDFMVGKNTVTPRVSKQIGDTLGWKEDSVSNLEHLRKTLGKIAELAEQILLIDAPTIENPAVLIYNEQRILPL